MPETNPYEPSKEGKPKVGSGDGKILTAPDPNQTGMPGGISFIVGNELAERFSFYGMKGILTIFMTCLLYTSPSPRDATLSRMPSSA